LQDRELAGEFVERSREKVARTFGWNIMVERTLDVLQTAVTK